ncbi:DUF6893 family small protein [Ktedonosporobacter rubrisoli]
MFKLLFTLLALGLGWVIVQQLPDIQRYMRIRSM